MIAMHRGGALPLTCGWAGRRRDTVLSAFVCGYERFRPPPLLLLSSFRDVDKASCGGVDVREEAGPAAYHSCAAEAMAANALIIACWTAKEFSLGAARCGAVQQEGGGGGYEAKQGQTAVQQPAWRKLIDL
jgi:hypothetical protein